MKKILIVDDQNEIRLLIRLALRDKRYEIYEASDAQMALNIVTAVKLDLMILDIRMPVANIITTPGILDGLDLCRYLKKNSEYSELPIVMLSTCSSTNEINAGKSAGANDYIVKPFQLQNLLSVISQQIEGISSGIITMDKSTPDANAN